MATSASPNATALACSNTNLSLQARQKHSSDGGVFFGWVAVIIAEVETRKSYERILELGGAVVRVWTIDHLLALDNATLAKLTHIFIDPSFGELHGNADVPTNILLAHSDMLGAWCHRFVDLSPMMNTVEHG
jgi:hypothetical protein